MGYNGVQGANVIGARFGRLVVLRETEAVVRSYPGRAAHYERRVICLCDCGRECTKSLGHLRKGCSISCGCFRRELVAKSKSTHGEARGGRRTAEYRTWKAMKGRCCNPNSQDYRLYGGRGIRVCDEWIHDFESFLAHVGRRPSPRHSIDRINNDGNYEPGNVRWATPKMQRNNQRSRAELRGAQC